MGGGGCVPSCSGLFAPGGRFSHDGGGKGVRVCGVDDVTHLILGLKNKHERIHKAFPSILH